MLPECLTMDRTGGVATALAGECCSLTNQKDPSRWALEVGGSRSHSPSAPGSGREPHPPGTQRGAVATWGGGACSFVDTQTLLGPVRYSDTACKPSTPSGSRTLPHAGIDEEQAANTRRRAARRRHSLTRRCVVLNSPSENAPGASDWSRWSSPFAVASGSDSSHVTIRGHTASSGSLRVRQ